MPPSDPTVRSADKRLRLPWLYRRGSESPGHHPRTLQIGGSPFHGADLVVPWDQVDVLPAVIQFSLVIVCPDSGTEEAQARLLDVLPLELGVQRQVDTRVVWILNEHTVDVASRLELGFAVALRGLTGGSVETELEDLRVELTDVRYAVPPTAKGIPLCWWARSDGQSRVALAMMTRDTRWLLLPPFVGDLPRAIRSRIAPVPSRAMLWGTSVGVAIAWAAAVAGVLLQGPGEYRQQVAEIGNGEFAAAGFPVPDIAGRLDSTWLPHPERMAIRILAENADDLASLAPELATRASAYELWRSGRATVFDRFPDGSLPYYYLALLAGDLPSAYRIVRESENDVDGSGWWDRGVMNTLWQAAVESLHELDFDRSRMYTQMYIATSQSIAAQTDFTFGADRPDRNLTLARILHREFVEGRIFALCNGQNARDTFGWLLGGAGWGYPFPQDVSPVLRELRETNSGEYCASAPERGVDYGVLPQLGMLRMRTAELAAGLPTEPVCSLTPLECLYLTTRAGLLADPDPGRAQVHLQFAMRCSYLSDDAIVDVLDRLGWFRDVFMAGSQGANAMPLVSVASLEQAMECTSPEASDVYGLLEVRFAELSCDQLLWDLEAGTLALSRHAPLAELERRCRS